MDWFILFFIVMGILLAIIPNVITNKIKKGVELDYWERDNNFSAASAWSNAFAWAIYFTSGGMGLQADLLQDKDIKNLERRIEALETPPQVDTINLVDIIKENGNF